MEFDKSKIITCLDDNIEQWVGWSGYCENRIRSLICEVETEGIKYKIEKIKSIANIPQFNTIDGNFDLFYPVEPPEEKAEYIKYRPYKDLLEIADELAQPDFIIKGEEHKFKVQSVMRYLAGVGFLKINGFDIFRAIEQISFENNCLIVGKCSYTMKELFDLFEYPNGEPFGYKMIKDHRLDEAEKEFEKGLEKYKEEVKEMEGDNV